MWTFGSLCWTQMFSAVSLLFRNSPLEIPRWEQTLRYLNNPESHISTQVPFPLDFPVVNQRFASYLPWILLCCNFHGQINFQTYDLFGQDGCLSSLPLQYRVAHCADTIGASQLNLAVEQVWAGWISRQGWILETSRNGGFVIAFLSWRVLYLPFRW